MNLEVVKYLSDEVERQGDPPSFVYHMARAWNALVIISMVKNTLNETDIMEIGALVKNRDVERYRNTPVTFASGGHASNPAVIYRSMESLMANMGDLSPDEFAFEFLKIHPFEDGNGRVASLVRNFMLGTLIDPSPLPYYDFS